MDLSTVLLKQDTVEKKLELLMREVPYARFIGMQVQTFGQDILFVLPPLESNIGNPSLPAIHGGCIGGFMEQAALCQVMATINCSKKPKTVDFSIDYLRPGRFKPTYARCRVVRQGRQVVNVSVHAWQERRNELVASARCHMLTTKAPESEVAEKKPSAKA